VISFAVVEISIIELVQIGNDQNGTYWKLQKIDALIMRTNSEVGAAWGSVMHRLLEEIIN
jgi:hypothetical protein